jgi:hypothetical protein
MLTRILSAAFAAAVFSSAVFAHGGGGGGGGGHGGGHYVYIPIYMGGGGGIVLPPPDAEIGDYSHIHSVAVLSGFAQTLNLKTGGIFGKNVDVDISGWDLDDYTAKAVAKHLASRFDVHTIAYDRPALAKIPKGDTNESLTQLHGYFATLQNPGVDAYVVIRPDNPGAYPATPGLALGSGGGIYPLSEWVGFEIEIFDAHTFQRIARCFARLEIRHGAPAKFAGFVAPRDRAPDASYSLTDAQRELLRKDFRHDIAETVYNTLRALQLGLPIPPPGDEPLIPIPPQANRYPQIRNVAVVSTIGDSFTMAYRTVMFEHHTTSIPIGDWNLDMHIEAMIRAQLDKRFTVKSVPVDRGSLESVLAAAPFPGLPYSVLPATINGLPMSSDVDAYVVVIRRVGPMGDATDPVSGVGIWKRKPFGSEFTELFANYAIVVVDAHTLGTIAHLPGVASRHQPIPTVYRSIDNAIWPSGEVDALAPAQIAQVQQILNDMLADSMGETLLEMGLTGMKRDLGDIDEPAPVSSAEPPEPGAPVMQQ